MTDADYRRVVRVLGSLVDRYVAAVPHLSRADLVQEAAALVVERFGRYDPARGSLETFAWTWGRCGIQRAVIQERRRSRGIRLSSGGPLEGNDDWDPEDPSSLRPLEAAEAVIDLEKLSKGLNRRSKRHLQTFLRGETDTEIAARTRVTRAAIGERRYRLTVLLRSQGRIP